MSGSRASFHISCSCRTCVMLKDLKTLRLKCDAREKLSLELLFLSWEKLNLETEATKIEKLNWREQDVFDINDVKNQGIF